MDEDRITRDDLEAELRAVVGDPEGPVASRRPTLVVERCGILDGLLDGAQGVVDMRLGLDWDAGGPASGSSR